MEFKVGDEVVFMRHVQLPGDSMDYSRTLIIGQTYIVSNTNSCYGMAGVPAIDVQGHGYSHSVDCFELKGSSQFRIKTKFLEGFQL